MGGTFNPIHLGHLHMANALVEALQLSEVRFIPSANPPHRNTPETSAIDRVAMVSIAIAGNPRFVLDTLELERTGYSYTIDTLISLRSRLGDQIALCWLMGSDAFLGLNTWHRWQELLDYCHIVIVQRPHSPLNTQQLPEDLRALLLNHKCNDVRELAGKEAGLIHIQEVAALDISSTQIRAMLCSSRNTSEMLPAKVLEYIHNNQLYLT